MKKSFKFLAVLMLLAVALTFMSLSASARTQQNEAGVTYVYDVVDGEAVITDFDIGYTGEAAIPETLGGYPVVKIGADVFDGSGVGSIIIPKTVREIDPTAFWNAPYLSNIEVDEDSPYFSSEMGVLYNKDKTRLIQVPNMYYSSKYTIPASVTSIDPFAFSYLSVVMNMSLDEDNDAFICENGILFNKDKTEIVRYNVNDEAESYTIPDGITSIAEGAFLASVNLDSIFMPNSVKNIGAYAFYGSSIDSLTLPEGLETIGDYAFAYCYLKNSVNIPASVKSIGNKAFKPSVEVTIDSGNEYYSVENNVIFNKDKTVLIDYPFNDHDYENTDYVIPDGVKTIADNAFADCCVANLTIPESVVSVGENALSWWECKAITVDGNNAYFSSDSNGVLFNKDKTTLIKYPHSNGATAYIIPDSVAVIADGAFKNAENLTSIEIGKGVEVIDEDIYYLENLETIIVDDNNEHYSSDSSGVLFNKTKTTLIRCPDDNESTEYVIPDGVTTIGNAAFMNCYIDDVVIPDSVTTVEDYAFWLSGINNIEIGSGVINVGEKAWTGFAFKNVIIDENNGYFFVDEDGNIFSKDKTVLYRYNPLNENTIYTVPDSVTTIEAYAFAQNEFLTNVTLTDNVTSIGSMAFYECTNLVSVDMPERVESFGFYMFAFCSKLKSLEIPEGVKTIGIGTFASCTSLETVTLPETLKTIDYYAFALCSSLKNLEFPDSLEIILTYAFPSCSSFTEIILPENVRSVHQWTFGGCDNVKKVTIHGTLGNTYQSFAALPNLEVVEIFGEGVYLGDGIFAGCEKLKTVILPDDIRIYNAVFWECPNLTDVYFLGTEEEWNNVPIGENNEELLAANIHFCAPTGVSPTCTTDGYLSYTCACCGYTVKEEAIPALGHNESEWIISKEATYVEVGIKFTKCTRCGKKMAELFIEKLPSEEVTTDDLTLIYGKESFDDEVQLNVENVSDDPELQTIVVVEYDNYQIYDITLTVNGVLTQPNDKVWVKIEIPEGYNPETTAVYYIDDETGEMVKMNSLTENGYIYFETDHFSYYSLVDERACQHTGGKATCCAAAVCVRCGKAYGEADSSEHENIVTVKGTEATCTATGLTEGKKCLACGEVVTEQTLIPKKAHTYSEWIVIKDATCEQKGQQQSICIVCKEPAIRDVKATGHSYGDDRICTVCGDEKACTHMCHQSGLMGFIWKIVRVFWKLFRMNPVCECGAQHW